MGISNCDNCGGDRGVGRVICTYCQRPCSSELLEGAIACPSCRTLSTSDQQKCVACGVWIVVQCVFCAATSPYTATACTTCREIFAGAAERKARGEHRSSTAEDDEDDEDEDGPASPELFDLVRTAAERFTEVEEDEEDDSLSVTVGDERVIVFVHEDNVTVWAAGSVCSSDEEAQALLVRAGTADWGRIFLAEPDNDGDESYQVEAWLPGEGLSVSLLRKVIVEVAKLAADDESEETEGTEETEETEETEDDDVEAVLRAAAKEANATVEADGESFTLTLSREEEDVTTTVFVREESVEIWSAVGTCGDTLDARAVLREASELDRLRTSIDDTESEGLFLCVEAYVPRRGLSAELLVELFDEVATATEVLAPYVDD